MIHLADCFMPDCEGTGELVERRNKFFVGCTHCPAQTGYSPHKETVAEAWNSIDRSEHTATLQDVLCALDENGAEISANIFYSESFKYLSLTSQNNELLRMCEMSPRGLYDALQVILEHKNGQ